MKYPLSFILLILCITGFSQGKGDFENTGDLAQFIDSVYKTEDARVLAAYRWITKNIRYSGEDVLPINRNLNPRAIIDVAFQRRKGVCENFASIFTDVCQKMGFRSMVIDGYTKYANTVDSRGHSWSAVEFNDNWYLFDPTWDASNGTGLTYFKKTGEEFIKTHMPFDPMWQLLDKTISYTQFASGQSGSNSSYFNYKDSISKYQNTDSLTRYTAALVRIEKSGKRNRPAELHFKILQGNIEDQKEQSQMDWYNEAAHLLNQSRDQLNQFIEYRNHFFEPVKPDDELKGMLSGIEKNISEALSLFDKIDRSDAKLVYGTEPVREQVRKFYTTFKNQQSFLSAYLETPLPERKKLFYK